MKSCIDRSMVGTSVRDDVGLGFLTIIFQNKIKICFCPGWTQKVPQGGSCRWGEVQDNFALWRSKRAPSKFGTVNWQAGIIVAFTGTREIGQSWWQLADTGVMTWYDDISAMILGPQAWKETSLGPPASEESCLQKITAENHVRTWTEPEYSTFFRTKTKQRPAQTGVWALLKYEVHSGDKECNQKRDLPCFRPGLCIMSVSCYQFKKLHPACDLCLVPNVRFRTSSKRFPK